MESSETEREKYGEMVVSVMGKLLSPVGRMIEVVDAFEEIVGNKDPFTSTYQNNQQNQQLQQIFIGS